METIDPPSFATTANVGNNSETTEFKEIKRTHRNQKKLKMMDLTMKNTVQTLDGDPHDLELKNKKDEKIFPKIQELKDQKLKMKMLCHEEHGL